jgi:hypothetical protein
VSAPDGTFDAPDRRRDQPAVLLFDLDRFEFIDLGCVDRLASLVLEAQRLGFALQFLRADDELRALVSFVGLEGVIAFREPDPDIVGADEPAEHD